mgnify:CR=1 FL=1
MTTTDSRIYQLELKVLYEISGIMRQVLFLDQALGSILKILSDSLAMERATVTLKDGRTGVLRICASHSLGPEEKRRGVYEPNEGVTGLIFRKVQPMVVPDIGKEPLFLNKTGARDLEKEAISFIGVPIVLNGEPIGVLSVDRLFGSDVSSTEDVRFLTIVATLISHFVHLNHQIQKREKTLVNENRSLRAEISEKYNHFFAVGVSPAMQTLKEMIRKVAPSRASVLLLGESGTGKTLTARIIHELSQRGRCPFIKVNCAALPDNLIESELFGHEKGAFTGAQNTQRGRFEEAESGTLFLDEIGELPLGVQAKLLRFLQDREFERLGSGHTRKLDVRIVAATNMDLATAVEAGKFRGDLYHRLNVFPISIPPLRHRKADIPLLADYFIGKMSRDYGKPIQFSLEVIDLLIRYNWPGNVRELENLIERLYILAEDIMIGPGLLPSAMRRSCREVRPSSPLEVPSIETLEKEAIVEALERNNWIQQRAAREIGLTSRQMGYRVKKFGLDDLINQGKKSRQPLPGSRASPGQSAGREA